MSWLKVNKLSISIPVIGERSLRRRVMKKSSLGGNFDSNKNNKYLSVNALNDISFNLGDGDRLALIGHNGAGKTTLLRTLAGIYRPMQGNIQYQGKLAALFNMSLGIEMEMSGYENIFAIATLLGLSKKETLERIDDIIEFTDLADFIHLPVKTYSAGMLTRLSFAVATSTEPDILILDEQIGAGDSKFASKVESRLQDFYSKIKIIIIASHSNSLLEKICNKGLVLEKGRIKFFGDIKSAIDVYENKEPVKQLEPCVE